MLIGMIWSSIIVLSCMKSDALNNTPLLISCGLPESTRSESPIDGRVWQSDDDPGFAPANLKTVSSVVMAGGDELPYKTARVFWSNITYSMSITPAGPVFIRLYFFPNVSSNNTLRTQFSTSQIANDFTLLQDLNPFMNSPQNNKTYEFQVILQNGENNLNLTFSPGATTNDTYGYVNGIEIESIPEGLYIKEGNPNYVYVSDMKAGYIVNTNSAAFQTAYRVNVGGELVDERDDNPGGMKRKWEADGEYVVGVQGVKVEPKAGMPGYSVNYTKTTPPYVAPKIVYETSRIMGDKAASINSGRNLTWVFEVDPGFDYVVRLHLREMDASVTGYGMRLMCVYIGGYVAQKDLDIWAEAAGLGIPMYKDFVITIPATTNGTKVPLSVALHPNSASVTDVTLNGLEILKLRNGNNLAVPNPPYNVMDSQSYSNINNAHDEVNDEATHSEGHDEEIDFQSIDLLDDEEVIPDYLTSLEQNMSGDDEENNLSNNEDECDGDNNEHSIIENVEAPQDGMEFETVQELVKHLSNYAKQCGFSVRKRNVKPPPKTKLPPKHILWICHKGGKQVNRSQNKIQPRPSQMIECKAKFNAKEFEGRWRFTKVELDHNHDLNPEDVRYLRAYRKLPKEVERRILINDEAGIRPSRTYLSEAVKNHGFQNLSYLEKDVRNLLQKKRQEKLAGPDSIAMYHYFMKSMKESDNFFFMLDLEHDGRLRNVMWVDARSRAAYKDFCDAVGLDTTYLNNKYEMPFAPFIGINHHGQTILLGCALLSREDTESFRWLLRTWVDCMGVAPGAIITDQSIPITKAVEMEMPNTRHRWCLWHIMEKQHKKLKNYKDFEKIKAAMANCVYDSLSVDEFEVGWKSFVDVYGLAKNAWLYTLYKDRRRWVPAFVNDCFWAGMSSTQRNESVNAFFKHYVNSKTSLKQFVLKYDLALGAKCDKERLLDHQSKNTRYKIVSKFAAERVFQPIYTHYAFQRVMEEVRGCMYTTPSIFVDEEDYSEYKVEDTREFGDLPIEKRVEYMVRLDKGTNHVQCSCKLFEMRGIMCRHTLKVIYDCGVQQIPDLYILRRWRKDIDRPYTRVKVPYYNPLKSEIVARYEKMQEEFEKVAIKAMNTEEEFGIVMNGITLINQNLTSGKGISGKEGISSEHVNENEESQDVIFVFDNSDGVQTKVALQDPRQAKSVGRPRIRVRGRQNSLMRKTTSRRPNINRDTGEGSKSKKKKVSDAVNFRDEVDPEADDLLLSQIETSTDYCQQTDDLFNNTIHAGGYTEMMQYFEHMGQSNNQLTEDGRLNMNTPTIDE